MRRIGPLEAPDWSILRNAEGDPFRVSAEARRPEAIVGLDRTMLEIRSST